MLELLRHDDRTTGYGRDTSFGAPRARAVASTPQLTLGVARTAAEFDAVQRLRHDVFSHDYGVVFAAEQAGRDTDRFDAWCDHVIVRDDTTGRIVGTSRVLLPEQARKLGGYYAESEFDISALDPLRAHMVEVGRSCTHPDHRQGGAIMLLWKGVAQLMRAGRYRYALGCASVSLRDDGAAAAQVWRQVSEQVSASDWPRVRPHHRYPVEKIREPLPAKTPPLVKGYLRLGAHVCGDLAWDPDFNSADLPVLLDICRMNPRYRVHLGLDYSPAQ